MNLKSCVLCRNFISIYKINRTLHGRLGIRILSSSAESISHSFASLTRERYFQHSKIKFVSPSGHVISSISITTIKLRMNWSGMIYFPTGSSDFTMILGCMTENFLYLSFSTLYSSSLWRNDTIVVSWNILSPPSLLSPSSSNGLEKNKPLPPPEGA